MHYRIFSVLLLLLISGLSLNAQSLLTHDHDFDKGDTLRGTLNEMRDWYDVVFYDLNIKVDPEARTIEGYNDIHFTVEEGHEIMQVDLFENLNVDKVEFGDKSLKYTREYNAVFLDFEEALPKGTHKIRFHYSGKPRVAKRAPWDGGFSWDKDEKGNHWIGVSCQGLGASVWWPNKDHQSEEPDSMRISCAVPTGLTCVSNGNLRSQEVEGDYTRFNWFVHYPINNYAMSINIGKYAHFQEFSVNGDDSLALDYYVLDYNLEKAKKHFQQVKPMMKCYEEFLTPYPFPKDGFALVETPYLGMEHQSGIAYGNNYKTGYNGFDYSRIGLDFDYIIIHEAGHEWWGNSITTEDIADMWIHEGFCTYSEAIYVECMHGYDTAMDYVNAKKASVSNDRPIIGPYGVNEEGSGDMYNKGMLILNTIRHAIGNDDIWFEEIIKGLLIDFEHQVVTSAQVEEYINKKSGMNFDAVFDQYLRHTNPPTLRYKLDDKGKNLSFKWDCDVEGFDLKTAYYDAKGKKQTIAPTTKWQTIKIKKMKSKKVKFDKRSAYFLVKKGKN